MFFRSPSGTSFSLAPINSINLFTGTLSPVSAASSAFSDALSSNLPSAGTASPASSKTTSPTTNSSLGTMVRMPSRRTRLFACAIFCNASMAFSALLSWYTPNTALMSTTARMMITSAKESFCKTAVTPDTTAAAISTRIIGLASSPKNLRTRDTFFPAFS